MKTSRLMFHSDLFLALRRQQEREAKPRLLHRWFPFLAPMPRRDRGVQLSPTETVYPNRTLKCF